MKQLIRFNSQNAKGELQLIARFFVDVTMKSKERDSEISESGLSVSSDEIVEKLKKNS